ncbi:MAG: hypothetical protein COA96_10235 [SAR86 cluster bacterium]|uniref:Uncharacterized protein n=1 Tax=SAR86 cluster bacterium TaxID=2030880 RepID=A0A2A5AXT5_9GAMM|nr:MAG: hypothetical protein COA96_10235 [SAR86 cluster bacterium]
MTYVPDIDNRVTVQFHAVGKRSRNVRKARADFDIPKGDRKKLSETILAKLQAMFPTENITVKRVERWIP